MDKLSPALNLGSQRILSASLRLGRRTLEGIPLRTYAVSILLPICWVNLGILRESMVAVAPARLQTKIILTFPCLLSVSATKPRLLTEKYISLSETVKVGQ